jgi:hypothetical protein
VHGHEVAARAAFFSTAALIAYMGELVHLASEDYHIDGPAQEGHCAMRCARLRSGSHLRAYFAPCPYTPRQV